MTLNHTENNTLWYKATAGPWSNGTVIRYKIASWHSDGDDTKYAERAGDSSRTNQKTCLMVNGRSPTRNGRFLI